MALVIESAKGIKFGNGMGEETPEITGEAVRFNGWAEDNLDNETFAVYKNRDDWDFCKTARKPYDTLVVACLAAGKMLGVIESWSSDGSDEDHQDGYNLAVEVLTSSGVVLSDAQKKKLLPND